ncbi:hypothetical protein VTN00DRAFT_1767 [Thermoascus crustaceus]|uniref:uncharacterized protein n=1 Tax=Thermoascus crustaceus TaxID=5088 RepID=UPI0037448095
MPLVFRVVNGQGTNDDQLNGGFLSAGFFIPWNQASVGSSIAQAPTPKPTTADSSTSPAAATSTAAEGNGTSHNNLGIGLGVGLGVPLVIALAAILHLLRRSRRKAATATTAEYPPPAFSTAFVENKDPKMNPTMLGYTSYFRGELEGDHAPRYELQSERRSTEPGVPSWQAPSREHKQRECLIHSHRAFLSRPTQQTRRLKTFFSPPVFPSSLFFSSSSSSSPVATLISVLPSPSSPSARSVSYLDPSLLVALHLRQTKIRTMFKMHFNLIVFVASWVLAELALGAKLPREVKAIEAHGFEVVDPVDNVNVYGANDASFFAKFGKLFPRGDVVTVTVTECGPSSTPAVPTPAPSPTPESSTEAGETPTSTWTASTPGVSPTGPAPAPSVTPQSPPSESPAPTPTDTTASPVPSGPTETGSAPAPGTSSSVTELPSHSPTIAGVSPTPASTAPVPSHTPETSNDAPYNEGTTAAMLAMAVGLVALVTM